MHLAGALAAALLIAVASQAGAAPSPTAPLVAAELKTAAVSSFTLDLSIVATQGGRTTRAHLTGVADRAHDRGRYVLTLPGAAPGHSPDDEIVAAGKVYVHYPLLDSLHARDARVKHWVVGDASATLGVGTWSVGKDALDAIGALTGVKATGPTSHAGVAVTRSTGEVALADAPRLAAQFEQVLGPGSASSVDRARAGLELWIGADGYVHRELETLALGVPGEPAIALRIVVGFGRFGAAVAPIALPAATDVMTPAQLQKLATVTAPAADTALLGKVVLAPAQIGAGYTGTLIPGGTQVQGQVTLDFCGLTYPSEVLRVARLQVRYTNASAPFEASNEVVTYTPGGAEQALRELGHAVATCPTGRVARNAVGTVAASRKLRRLTDPRLLPGSVAILDDETATVAGKVTTVGTVAVYQVRGRVLSGVYAIGGTDAARTAFALHAAELSAARLRANA